MEIISLRKWFTDKSTISELSINQGINPFCYVLEPTIRIGKDPRGIVAIPEGRYEVSIYESPRFNMKVPLLKDVPGHSFVEIHPGNSGVDTHDCLLPGLSKTVDWVTESRNAFNLLYPQIDNAINALQKVYITIKNGGEAI